MKINNIIFLCIIFMFLFLSSISYGLDFFYSKGELGIGYGYGVKEKFEIVNKIELGFGISKDISINFNKSGADINIGLLYNLGFPFKQKGIASWYGKKDHGKLTASGEPYNMNALTAAHRSLPFGTLVKVTNLQNGKSVVVRINDRGPFVKGRIIDLSYKAAKKIDLLKVGTTPVSLKVLDVSGLSIKLGYETGSYNGIFHIGGVFEFPVFKNVSGILELHFLPNQTEFMYGGGILINLKHPFKVKVGIDNISSLHSSDIFLEIMLKF